MKTVLPNILWICTDQQRFDTVGALGNPHIRTPNIDRLVREGVVFDHCYCQNPICSPSRASFLTGRYPRTTRLRQNGTRIPDDEVLVPRILKDNGYVCGLAGKLHLGPCERGVEERIDDGYQDFHWSHGPWPRWEENEYIRWVADQGTRWEEIYPFMPERFGAMGAAGGDGEGQLAWPGMPAKLHQTHWCAEKAIEFMSRNKGRPWLFSVNPFDPHHPFDPPPEMLAHYDPDRLPPPEYREGELVDKPFYQQRTHEHGLGRSGQFSFLRTTDRQRRQVIAAYYAMVENVDAAVGRMIGALEATGQLENTVIVFISDHGEMLGDHGLYLKGPFMYEQAVRVPLILSAPGRLKSGLRSDALVELVDLAPTLLELAGVPVPERMQGKSLLRICGGQADPHHHKDRVYCEYYNTTVGFGPPRPYVTMMRDSAYKIVVYAGLDEGELYDVSEDPGEFENLWNRPECRDLRFRYLKECMDASIFTMDPLPIRVSAF
jgi:arylsulfatase A-like enzyme